MVNDIINFGVSSSKLNQSFNSQDSDDSIALNFTNSETGCWSEYSIITMILGAFSTATIANY